MKTHEIIIAVDRSAAALAGVDVFGDVRVPVNPSALTDRQRRALASLGTTRATTPTGCDEYLPYIRLPGIASAEDVPSLLDRVADRAEQQAADQARALEEATARQITKILDLPLTPPDLAVNPRTGAFEHKTPALCDQSVSGAPFRSVLGGHWMWDGHFRIGGADRRPVLEDPRVAELLPRIQAECARLNAEQEASMSEAKARNDAEAAAKEAEQKAADNRRAQQLAEWVVTHGTENQRQRFARGMLPESEILDGIAHQAFRSLADFPPFRPVRADEVIREAEGQLGDFAESAGVDFRVHQVAKCSAELFNILRAIEEAIQAEHPDATCTLRRHIGWIRGYDDEDDPEVVQFGVLVGLKVGELALSREYAADA